LQVADLLHAAPALRYGLLHRHRVRDDLMPPRIDQGAGHLDPVGVVAHQRETHAASSMSPSARPLQSSSACAAPGARLHSPGVALIMTPLCSVEAGGRIRENADGRPPNSHKFGYRPAL